MHTVLVLEVFVTASKGTEHCNLCYDQCCTSLTALPLPTFLPLKYFPRLRMPTCINSRLPDMHSWLAGAAHTAYIQFSIRGISSMDLCLTSSKHAACMTSELDLVLLDASLRTASPAQCRQLHSRHNATPSTGACSACQVKGLGG